MIILEHNMIEIDYCTGCGGMWLDEGELELLTGNKFAGSEILNLAGKERVAEKLRKCPRCDKKMEKTVTPDNIMIDRCVQKHGLWFDKGELLQVISSAGDEENNPVRDFLKDLMRT